MMGGASTEIELRGLEETLGRPLPEAYRLFLRRVGGGVFYLKHEIFGAHRVMIHDIELVPDVLSFRTWLRTMPPTQLPIHRADGRIHVIDLDTGECAPLGPAVAGQPRYRDFATFLAATVLP
jgi:hypothetical protein